MASTTQEAAHQVPSSNAQPVDDLPETNELEADSDADSAFGGSDATGSETESIASVYKGYFRDGRRYSNLADRDYFQPADDKQWESFNAGHMLFLILDSQRRNTLFRSPLSPKAQNIIDIGTGTGDWALDVADRFPNITVRGVDIYPPPQPWTAPNCIFEADDVSKNWTWKLKFDLAHIRHFTGSLNAAGFNALYKRVYDNLEPGGWIEQVEMDVGLYCDDGSLPADSLLASHWKSFFEPIAEKMGCPLDAFVHMRSRIEEAGFRNVHQQDYKCPLGNWPSLQVYKDAGRVSKMHFLSGMEGWIMYFLTQHGEPKPWTTEEVHVFLAKIRVEVNSGWHIYQKARRVWAQKPFDKDTEAREEPIVKRFASASLSPKQPSKKTQAEEGKEA